MPAASVRGRLGEAQARWRPASPAAAGPERPRRARSRSRTREIVASTIWVNLGVAAPVRKDQELELEIDSLAYGGNGVARLNGFVVFVRRGLPGDTVRARVTNVKRNHAEALAVEVIRQGPERVDAPCVHYPACGGCRFQDLAYEAQVAAKEQQVREALRRIGGLAEPPLEPILPAVEVFHYRNKLEYSFAQTPAGAALGFHKAGRWDEVLDIERCWLTTELGNAVRLAVRDWARAERLPAYDQAEQTGYLRHLVVREGRNTGQVLVQLVTAPGELKSARESLVEALRRFPEVRSIHWSVNDRPAEVTNLPTQAALGRGRDRGGALRPALPRPPERLPADEHRDGRAALPARARVRGADGRGDRLRPVLRHRDDRADLRAGGADGLGRGGVGGVGRLRARELRAERDRERGVLRGRGGRFAGGARRPGRPAGRGRRRSAARRAFGKGAPADGAAGGARGSSTSPATRRRSRAT